MKLVREMAIVAMAVLAGAPSLAQGETKKEGAQLLQEISAARVRIDVDGDLAAVQEELTKLEERLRALGSAAPQAAQRKLLEAQVAAYLKRNKVAEANALLERAGSDPTLDALRAQVRGAAEQGDTAFDSLVGIVDDCIADRDWNRLRALGSAAVDRVAQVALASASDFPEVDLLPFLVDLDERLAVTFLIDHFEAGGPLWKKRIHSALRSDNSLHDLGTWTNDHPYVLLEPELLGLYERLLREPGTANSALRDLVEVEDRDALTPGLVHAIVEGLKTRGPDFTAATMALFDGPAVSRTAKPILEAALGVPDERIRRLAAEKLVAYERSEALLARSNDPDPFVRRCVALALGSHQTYLQEGGRNADRKQWNATIAMKDLPRLQALIQDADPSVRALATHRLQELETPLAPSEYERLAHDDSEEVRIELLRLTRLPDDLRPRLLALLATDASERVIDALDYLLAQAANWSQSETGSASSSMIARDPSPFLPALEVRWKAQQLPLDEDHRRWLREALLASNEGLRALVAWTLAAGDIEALVELVDRSSPNAMLALSDESIARLLASLPPTSGNGNIQRLWDAVRQAQPPRSAALRLLFADASAARRTRLTAALSAADGTEGYREALLGFLRQPTWKSEPVGVQEAKELPYVGSKISKADGGAACLTILRDASIPRELAQALLSNYPLDVPKSAELTREVLSRWFKPELPASEAVFRALEHLGSRPDLAQDTVLEEALVHPGYSYQAIRSMAALRNPAYLPKIARGLEAEWAPAGRERTSIQFEAAQALASFNDPAAAEYLLLGLRSSDDEVRVLCKAGLERLEEYETRARAWRERGTSAPTKESALAELVAMLAEKDPAIRRQAALGIATLGAVELIPQLIRLTKDADASVSQAAQKALDRLNAMEPAPAPVEGG